MKKGNYLDEPLHNFGLRNQISTTFTVVGPIIQGSSIAVILDYAQMTTRDIEEPFVTANDVRMLQLGQNTDFLQCRSQEGGGRR